MLEINRTTARPCADRFSVLPDGTRVPVHAKP
jgi:hypothetical protein